MFLVLKVSLLWIPSGFRFLVMESFYFTSCLGGTDCWVDVSVFSPLCPFRVYLHVLSHPWVWWEDCVSSLYPVVGMFLCALSFTVGLVSWNFPMLCLVLELLCMWLFFQGVDVVLRFLDLWFNFFHYYCKKLTPGNAHCRCSSGLLCIGWGRGGGVSNGPSWQSQHPSPSSHSTDGRPLYRGPRDTWQPSQCVLTSRVHTARPGGVLIKFSLSPTAGWCSGLNEHRIRVTRSTHKEGSMSNLWSYTPENAMAPNSTAPGPVLAECAFHILNEQ